MENIRKKFEAFAAEAERTFAAMAEK